MSTREQAKNHFASALFPVETNGRLTACPQHKRRKTSNESFRVVGIAGSAGGVHSLDHRDSANLQRDDLLPAA